MELDLSHTDSLYINTNMNLFDQEVNNILQEAQFGRGAISNQSGAVTPNPNTNMTPTNAGNPSTNAQPKFANNPQQLSATNPVANPNAPNPNSGAVQTGVDDEAGEFQKLLALKDVNPNQFNTALKPIANDQAKFGRFVQYLTSQTVPTK